MGGVPSEVGAGEMRLARPALTPGANKGNCTMSKNKSVPAYLSLVLNVLTRGKKLGVSVPRDMSTKSTLPENNGFCFVSVDGGDACLIIPKHAKKVMWCDLHIDWAGKAGYIEAVDSRGAVVCQIDPSEVDLDLLLTSLSGADRPSKKGASKSASMATSEMIALLQGLDLSPDSEEESEEAEGSFEEPASEEPALTVVA